MPADRGGIEEDLGALHRGEPRAFGEPLIPADQHADASRTLVFHARKPVSPGVK